MKKQPKIKKFGFVNVDKPSGIVSSAVVNKLKWLTGLPCGHMGTLDPLASGVLPVGVGNATRLFDYFLDKEKEYIAAAERHREGIFANPPPKIQAEQNRQNKRAKICNIRSYSGKRAAHTKPQKEQKVTKHGYIGC